ncbi:hypothetical protein D3C87_1156800 [compost metagenome]
MCVARRGLGSAVFLLGEQLLELGGFLLPAFGHAAIFTRECGAQATPPNPLGEYRLFVAGRRPVRLLELLHHLDSGHVGAEFGLLAALAQAVGIGDDVIYRPLLRGHRGGLDILEGR